MAALCGQRHLLILDNLESVTASPLAIPHSLDTNRREELRAFLAALAGGQTLVLMASRGDEAWLGRGTFAGNVYQLEGLDPEAASDLADAVLQRAGAQGRREESAFKDLMTLLAGYPLALQVVLPHLAGRTAAVVLDELRRGVAGADAVPGADPVLDRTRSLMACIEYSHGHLDPDDQALLTCFAPFTGVINTGPLEHYRENLAVEPALAGLPLRRLSQVLERARSLGLLQRDVTRVGIFLRPQPAMSWFLTRRLDAANQTERRAAIERAFRNFYDAIARGTNKLQSSNKPDERQFARLFVEEEYANLGTALCFAIDHQASILDLYSVLSEHLERLHDHRRGLELGEQVLEKLEKLPLETLAGWGGLELLYTILDIAKRQLTMREFERAQASCKRALALLDSLKAIEPRFASVIRASVLHRLGVAAQEQRRFAEAESTYNKALEIFLAVDDRHRVATTYRAMGDVALLQIDFAEAEDAYKKALEIYVAFKDDYRAGVALSGIAIVWAATSTPGIPAAVASILKIDLQHAEEQLRKALKATNLAPPTKPIRKRSWVVLNRFFGVMARLVSVTHVFRRRHDARKPP